MGVHEMLHCRKMQSMPTYGHPANCCFFLQHLPIFAPAIARRTGKLYNLQPNRSSSQYFLGASAFIWLGYEFKKMGRCPFFFW
jgi:hypothetical protein